MEGKTDLFVAAAAVLIVGLSIAMLNISPAAQEKLVIESIDPESGPVGTVITVIGSGFAPEDNVVRFGGGYLQDIKSDGSMIEFTVPEGLDLCAPDAEECLLAYPQVLPGDYEVSVMNRNGESNRVIFTVT